MLAWGKLYFEAMRKGERKPRRRINLRSVGLVKSAEGN